MSAAEVVPLRDPGEELIAGRRQLDVGEAEWLAKLGEFDLDELWRTDGFFTAASWVAHKCRMGRSTAFEKLRVAQQLRRRPLIQTAFRSGDISYFQARLITRIEQPDKEVDETLVELAKTGSVRDLEQAIRYYQLLAAQDLPPARDRLAAKTAFCRVVGPGLKQLAVVLPDDEMAELQAVIDAYLDRRPVTGNDGDGAPAGWGERRADAILEIGRAALAATNKRAAGLDRYMTHVHINLPALLADSPGLAWLDDGTRSTPPPPGGWHVSRGSSPTSSVTLRTARPRTPGAELHHRPAPSDPHPRRAHLPVPRLRPPTSRLPPPPLVEPWRGHRCRQRLLLLPAPPHPDPPSGWRVEGDPDHTLTFYRPDGTVAGHSPPPGALPHL